MKLDILGSDAHIEGCAFPEDHIMNFYCKSMDWTLWKTQSRMKKKTIKPRSLKEHEIRSSINT